MLGGNPWVSFSTPISGDPFDVMDDGSLMCAICEETFQEVEEFECPGCGTPLDHEHEFVPYRMKQLGEHHNDVQFQGASAVSYPRFETENVICVGCGKTKSLPNPR